MRVSFVFALFILASCENAVRFEVPQPEGLKDEGSIPKKIQGSYLSLKDSTTIEITHDLIIRTTQNDYKGILNDLDSIDRAQIKGDTSYSEIESSARLDVTIKGDSIFQHLDLRDTLFSLANMDVLRKYKGYYFLNTMVETGRWNVTKLGMTKKGILLGTISGKEELANLRELNNVTGDTVYNFKPSRKRFKKFIKEEGFSSEEYHIRM